VVIGFANNFLSARMAESDYSSAKETMKSIGLQTDDVAWKIGQRETIRYSSRYGTINCFNNTLTYKIYLNNSSQPFFQGNTSIIYFNMPISQYTIANNWYQLIWPSQMSTLTLKGSSAPTAKVFGIEKLPMSDGNFIRVVSAPVIRVINSTIVTGSNSTFYFKLYLPLVSLKSAPRISQSVTLTGNSISVKTQNQVTSIRIVVSFPQLASGFDNTFFNFPSVQEIINAPSGYPGVNKDCVVELYTGLVTTELGAHV